MANAGTSKLGNVRANVVINLVRTLTMTILSFITFPFVTRALGDAVFGTYTWANTFVYYFLILAKISIPNIAIRECTKVKDDREALSHKAQEFFILQAIMTLLSFGLLVCLCYTVPSLKENNALIFLLSINFLAGVFSFEWIYIVLEKHFYITVRSILLIAFSAAMTFFFIRPSSAHPEYELHIYASITILSTVLTSVINCLLLPRHISLKKKAPYHFLPLLKPLLTLFFISLTLTLYNQTDEFLLGFFDPSKAAVGAYSVGVKGVDIIITLITSLYAVFMPRANYYYQKENKYFYQNLINYSLNITFFIAVPAIATMASMASPITSLISGTTGYTDANLCLVILSCMMLTYSIGDNIYTEILLPQKKEKYYLFTMIGGVVLNVGLSFLLGLVFFKEDPVVGVAIATAVADIATMMVLIGFGWEYAHKAVFNWNNLKIVVFGLVIGIASFFLCPLLLEALGYQGEEAWVGQLLTLLILVGGDAILYVGGLLLCKEKLVTSFLPSSRKRRERENA